MAPFGEDAGEEGFAGFEIAVFYRRGRRGTQRISFAVFLCALRVLCGEFLLLQLGFRGDEAAFAGGFEDGGAVAFEVGLHPPQRRHPRLQPGELCLNLRHDAMLFCWWGDWQR